MTKSTIKLAGVTAGMLVTSIAMGGGMGVPVPLIWGELNFSAGYYNIHQGKEQHIPIYYHYRKKHYSYYGNTYTLNNKNADNYLLSGGFYVNHRDFTPWNLSVGFKGFYLAKTSVQGKILHKNFYENLAYKYNITQVPLYIMARVMQDNFFQQGTLTLDAGIGPNIIHANGYREWSLDGGITTPDDTFSTRTDTKFSATTGVGFRFNGFMSNTTVEVGYRFFYLGQGSLVPRTDKIMNNLRTGHMYANSVILTMGWLV